MSPIGKTIAVKSGLYIICRCGLIFAFVGFRQRYNEHTYNCSVSLKEAGLIQ